MSIKELRQIVSEGLVSAEAEDTLNVIIGIREDGEFSAAEEEKVREILELEVELLDAKAGFYEDLVSEADKLGEELEEAQEPDFPVLISEFRAEEKEQIESLKKSVKEKNDLLPRITG